MVVWQTAQYTEFIVGLSTAVIFDASTGRSEILRTLNARKLSNTWRERPRLRFVGVVGQRLRKAGVVRMPAWGISVPS